MSSSAHVLGRSVPRLEDAPLLKGHGQFVADIAFPHQLHMRIVRSAYAHAELCSVDVAAALAAPGVLAFGPAPTSPTCPRSISATRPVRHCIRIASRYWRDTGCATSANRSPRYSHATPISPRMQPTSFR